MRYFFLFIFILLQGGDKIVIKNAWVRPAPKSFNTAFYFTVFNYSGEPDTLYKASSNVSDDVEIHETYKKGDMMGMRPVRDLVIAPHDSLLFKPGGYHVMIMNLKQNLKVNNSEIITLFFKNAGEIRVKAHVASF